MLADPDECLRRGRIGRRRMGPAGASARLAALIERRLLEAPAGSAAAGG